MKAALLILFACGCNQILGLDQSRTAQQDPDDDSVVNERDNCPDVANHDQADVDKDGLGDACDGCPKIKGGDPHDEDGDRTADICDLCPTVADFQIDSDGDGVGDACDTTVGTSTRDVFDGFQTFDAQWSMGDREWNLVGDSVAPTEVLAVTDRGLEHSTMQLGAAAWWIRATFTTKQRWQPGSWFGIVVRDALGATVASCVIACDATTACTISLIAPGSATVFARSGIDPLPIVRMFIRVDAATNEAQCKLEGTQVLPVVALGVDVLQLTGSPTFVATPMIHLGAIDVVEER